MKKTAKSTLEFTLNNRPVSCEITPASSLLDVLRDTFGLTGTKSGCNEGECGACTVLINGKPVNSCLFLAMNAADSSIVTIEGITPENGKLHPVQEALVQHGAVQCGFCTSGMVMSIEALKNHVEQHLTVPGSEAAQKPSRKEIEKWLEGNLCRCTGYVNIIDAAEELISKI